ncbi:MAG: hypothetical protein M3M94_06615 [Actinomycetota bacterium]|nr:hypothetical protein [Actinomycetota bacterium]
MTIIRLPSWEEMLAPGMPWALLLRSGSTGAWLLLGTAEDVEGLDARIVAGTACTTSVDALVEWSIALELGEQRATQWGEFATTVGEGEWFETAACGVLVSDAHRLLEREPERLTTLLESLALAARRLEREGRALRVVFQSRFDSAPEQLAVFREFAVAEIA